MKQKMDKILFDLDGTLTDSQEGITKGVQYALREKLGIEEPDLKELTCFIGPPLALMFKQRYQVPDELVEPLVDTYRVYYDSVGQSQNKLYPGIRELLIHLKEKGYILGVASSKPEGNCVEILKQHDVAKYFDYIVGASRGPERREKALVLEEAFRRMNVTDRSEVLLVGDTKYDAEGAKKAGIACLGVTYGFGTREELIAADAVAVCDTPQEVEAYLDGTEPEHN